MSHTASVWNFNRQASLLAIDLCVFWAHRGFKNVYIHLVHVLPALLLSVVQHDPVAEPSEKCPPRCGGVCAMLQGAGESCWHEPLLPGGQSWWDLLSLAENAVFFSSFPLCVIGESSLGAGKSCSWSHLDPALVTPGSSRQNCLLPCTAQTALLSRYF